MSERPLTTVTIDTADEEVIWILGRPNFWCGPYAHLMRDCGQDIPRKAELEQAAVIAWMLMLYAKHGKDWREHGKQLLADMKEERIVASIESKSTTPPATQKP